VSKIAAIIGVVGVVLAVAGFAGPWWEIGITGSILGQTFTSRADYGMFGGTATAQGPGTSITNTTDYSSDPNTRGVFQATTGLLGAGVGLGVVSVVLAALSGTKPRFRKAAAGVGVLAFVLAMAAPLYVLAQLPAAVNQDSGSSAPQVSGFWGSKSVMIGSVSTTLTWAAAWAWYVVLVGAILFLVGGILAMRAPKGAPAAPPMEAPAQMLEMPPQTPPEI
jgi:hypothetical protein